LLAADWSKNKIAQKSLLTPEMKPQGQIRLENKLLKFFKHQKMGI
jgi:hypothetical protein